MEKEPKRKKKSGDGKEIVKREKIVFLFEKFLKPDNNNFPLQSRIAKMLLLEYGEECWKYINLGFKLNTLGWFNKEEGQKIINKALNIAKAMEEPVKKTLDKCENYEYVRVTEKKEKSLRDLLQ